MKTISFKRSHEEDKVEECLTYMRICCQDHVSKGMESQKNISNGSKAEETHGIDKLYLSTLCGLVL